MESEEDLRTVMVQVATCSKCNGTVMLAVKNSITRKTAREFGKLIEDGCNLITTNVIVARSNKWCEEPCEGMWPNKKKKTKH